MARWPAMLLAVAMVALAACGDGSPDADVDDGLDIVVTTSVLGDVVGEIVGDAGSIEVLMPAGADPHTFSPSAQQAQALRSADLVVANGLGLEATMEDLLAAAEEDGARVLEVGEHVDALPIEEGREHEGEREHADESEDDDEHAGEGDHGDDHGGLDPHFWHDPLRMQDAVDAIAAALAEVATDAADWGARASDYRSRLDAAHATVESLLAAVPEERRTLVTVHDTFRYFAGRYDFEIVGTVLPNATDAAPSSRDFAELAETVRERGVPAIFAENVGEGRLVEALATEVGREVEVVELYTDALGPEGSDAATYVGMLETNARLIADALG